jgi:F420-dependent oxidoreductase-like protein
MDVTAQPWEEISRIYGWTLLKVGIPGGQVDMDVALMVEGQNGLNWPRWQRIVRAAEELGFAGLYRSDHFTNPAPPDVDSLELWTSLTWLADNTRRIEFGPLVTPTSVRHPVITARTAITVDDLSDGRLWLGVGAGWETREHEMFGFDLLNPSDRFNRFQESLEVITRLLRQDEPVSFDGQYYCLRNAQFIPRPHRAGGPPIVVGGNGLKATLPLAAHYADEWNAVFLPPDRFAQLNARLDEILRIEGRSKDDLRRTMMTSLIFGQTDPEVKQKLAGRSREDETAHGTLIGTAGEIIDQLGALQSVGVQRVMLQWLELDDPAGLEALAKAVLPIFR